MINNNSVPL